LGYVFVFDILSLDFMTVDC